MIPPTITVTFLYDHTSGTYRGTLENGVTFDFIAPAESNIPVKLKNRLHALARETAGWAYEYRDKTLNSPNLSDEEFHDMVETYLLQGGAIQKKRGRTKPRATLESLGLTVEDLKDLEL